MSAVYEIWNHGSTVDVPYRGSHIRLSRRSGFETSDPEIIELFKFLPRVSVKQVGVVSKEVTEIPREGEESEMFQEADVKPSTSKIRDALKKIGKRSEVR